MASNRKDLSELCNKDDEDMNNDCWHCEHFCFPIGCMYYEKEGDADGSRKKL